MDFRYMKYYVLWTRDSPLLKEYLEKYYQKLLKDLQAISEKWILVSEIWKLLQVENKDFILNPDQSSAIQYLIMEVVEWRDQWLWDSKLFIDILKREIDMFLAGENDRLCMFTWKKIGDTNIRLTLSDNNPYNKLNTHPLHKDVDMIWWWEKTEEEWLDVYRKSFEILKKVDEGFYDELNAVIKKIIPFGTAYGVHNSASYRECIGHLYMSYTVDMSIPELNNLEAIIHESSHNKLNLIMHFESIILNDMTEKYYFSIQTRCETYYVNISRSTCVCTCDFCFFKRLS